MRGTKLTDRLHLYWYSRVQNNHILTSNETEIITISDKNKSRSKGPHERTGDGCDARIAQDYAKIKLLVAPIVTDHRIL